MIVGGISKQTHDNLELLEMLQLSRLDDHFDLIDRVNDIIYSNRRKNRHHHVGKKCKTYMSSSE